MDVNLKGAAQNTFDGIKQIAEIIDNYDGEVGEEAQEIIDQINRVMVSCQPQLGAYCLLESFNQI
jgi:hypothetical protein